MAKQILKILDNRAVFKRRPVYAGDLPDKDKVPVKAGDEYEIQSYAYADSFGDFDEHIKFTLEEGNINGFNTWYVFNRYIEVEYEGRLVYPWEEQTAVQILRVTQDTILKRRPVQSSELPDDEQYKVPKGAIFELHSYAYADAQGDFRHHIKFAINNQDQYINGLSTWYVYELHGQVEYDGNVIYPLPGVKHLGKVPAPTPTPNAAPQPKAPGTYTGKAIQLPGGKGTVFTDQPILPGSSFTWGEATHGGTRIPQKVEHMQNMINLATHLEKARKQIGKPFRITSWYRPEPFNSRVGGARRSQHLDGKAVDIVVEGYMGRDLARLFVSWWPGGLGIYPGNRKHILHLDIGSKRKWGF